MGVFPKDDPEVVVQLKCPPLKSYDPADTQKAAAEMQALRRANPAAKSPEFFQDYGVMRRACRAIQN
ncbi:MAG: hypothetical protein JWN75_1251 [Candidatus Saccharibacteria bacterium]|nr:hypothetical protein [Candidatus Saccharibacteria bacterium]